MATTYPLDDDVMVYDLSKRMYILTKQGVKNEVGIDLASNELAGSDDAAKALLYECSEDVYEYIYSTSLLHVNKYKRYQISKNDHIREDFKRALLAQMRYMIRSGANLLKDMHSVHIEKSRALDLNVIRGARGISHTTERILRRIGLLYSGYMYYSDYEEDGTY